MLKLALDNSIKNILIRKGVEISSVEKLQTVQNRYEQIHRRDMEQQTAQAGFLRTAREVVDNAIDNGDDFKTIMRKVEHYMGTKRLQPDTLELLKQYVNQKTQENKPMTERQSITNPMFENVLQSLDIGAP